MDKVGRLGMKILLGIDELYTNSIFSILVEISKENYYILCLKANMKLEINIKFIILLLSYFHAK